MKHTGFTLAELLIALAILGIIATFTIPKVLQAQQASHWNTAAKEIAAMASEAFHKHKLEGKLTSATRLSDLTPYMNYIEFDNTSVIDSTVISPNSFSCSSGSWDCLKLASGAIIAHEDNPFGGTTNLHCVRFWVDPNSVYDGGPPRSSGRSVLMVIYYNGRLTSRSRMKAGSSCLGQANDDPYWFSWD